MSNARTITQAVGLGLGALAVGATVGLVTRQEPAPEAADKSARVAPMGGISANATRSASTPPASPRAAGAALATPARESTGPALFLSGFEGGNWAGWVAVRPHGPIFADGFEGQPRWSKAVGGSLVPVVPPPLDIVSESTHALPDRWRTVVYVVPRRPAQRLAILRADGSRWEQPYPAIRETWWLDQAGTLPCPCVVEVDEGARTWRAPLAVETW